MSLHDDLLEQAEQLAKIIVPCLLPSVETLGRRPTLSALREKVGKMIHKSAGERQLFHAARIEGHDENLHG